MKKVLAAFWLTLLLVVIGAVFWYNEVQYQLPTPVPQGYKRVAPGTFINLPDGIHLVKEKPLFLHFFNPDCPCSRFNIKQFKALATAYKNKVDFKIVAVTKKRYTADEIRNKFDLDIPVIFNDKIAALCGVYSTPQVALLDGRRQLYYRGNYNKSRYCTDEHTSYARIAVDSLLTDHQQIRLDKFALTAYGCSLPGCDK